jgi:hypothetical protein
MVDEAWVETTLATLTREDGFTSHPNSGTYTGGGYGVATYPERSVNVDLQHTPRRQLRNILQRFVLSNADLLSQPGHYVGGWLSSQRELVLDISIITSSRARAAELRDRHHQSCFYKFEGTLA